MSNYRSSFLSSIPPVVKNLIAINLIMWLATLVLPGFIRRWGVDIELSDVLGMHYWGAEKFNPAQMITYMFMHGGIGHLFFNMFALYMFGGVLENLWGPKKFLFYYLVTGVGAGLVRQIFWTFEFYPVINELNVAIAANPGAGLESARSVLEMNLNKFVTIGASGSVFGLLLAFGWLFPEVKLMMLFFPVPIKARIFVLIYGVAELFLGVANFSGDKIAHFAHLGGMIFGAILILIWKKKRF